MEYCPDSKRIYQHICCRMRLAISRSLELLEQGRWQEARDLLSRAQEEVDRLIESPRGVTLHLEEADS